MAYALRNREVFRAEVEGKQYTITCYTQSTSYGFRHVACEGFSDTTEFRWIKRNLLAKATYYNRTWERFQYETVLRNAIQNLDTTKEVKQELHDILIEHKAQKAREDAENFINSFKAIHESLNQENKDSLARMVGNLPNGMITADEQAQSIKGIATIMSLMQ